MKRIILITIIGCLATISSSSLFAQQSNCQMNKKCSKLTLSEDQKAEMKKIRLTYAEATLDTKNKLNEIGAQKSSLLHTTNPNQKKINALIDQKADLHKSLSKEKMKMRMAIHNLLTEEQRMKADCRKKRSYEGKCQGKRGKNGKGKMHAKQHKGKKDCTKNGKKKGSKATYLDLSDQQKEELKALKIKHQKEAQPLRNQMEELRLKQKHLFTTERIDEKMILQNSVKMTDVKTKMEKMKVEHQLECRKVFTDEQLILFLSHQGKGKRKARFHRAN